MLISCFLPGLESFGLFIGVNLSQYNKENLLQFKNSVEFFNKVSRDLEKFLDQYDYTPENIEKWHDRLINNFNNNCLLIILDQSAI